MASIIKVDTIQDQDGNNIINESANTITIGASGDTITIPSGATFASVGIDDNATSTAITISSDEDVTFTEDILLGDNKKAIFGAGSDLQIYHDGSFSRIKDLGTGALILDTDGTDVRITKTDTEFMAKFNVDSHVGLYYDNSEKFQTTSTGALILGRLSTSAGNASEPNFNFSADGNTGIYRASQDVIAFSNNGSETMRIDSSGNVGIGTTNTSPRLYVVSNSNENGMILDCVGTPSNYHFDVRNDNSSIFRIDSSGNVGIGTSSPTKPLNIRKDNAGNSETLLLLHNNSATDGTEVEIRLAPTTYPNDIGSTARWSAIRATRLGSGNATDLSFLTNQGGADPTERMRINSYGTLFVGVTSEPSTGDNGAQIGDGIYHVFARNTPSSAVFRTYGSSGLFQTLGNGNAQNTNNSYGSISDRELKENEVDANSQWNDIKALQIKNYNLKSEPNQTHLGVIAQDLEASGMNGLVEQNQDEIYSENDVLPEGKNIGDVKEKGYKTVKYSILYMKAVKALQEAMERIETLEAKVQTLENNQP
jgi:hypothetical protein